MEVCGEITASCVIAKVKTGVPSTEDPCRGSKEKGGTPWWCTPGVIDRAEARGSDSGLTVDASEPLVSHISPRGTLAESSIHRDRCDLGANHALIGLEATLDDDKYEMLHLRRSRQQHSIFQNPAFSF